VLRTNDLGDVLLVTPLLESLRHLYPRTRIIAAVGPWSVECLRNNPNVSQVVALDAPWANKYVPRMTLISPLRFLVASPELRALRRIAPDIGIDVCGTVWGSMLLHRTRCRFRLGVDGYLGGHSTVDRCIQFDSAEHVATAGLRFAQLLGAQRIPEPRPQIFLTREETDEAGRQWSVTGNRRPKIVLAPGGYKNQRWPADRFAILASMLARETDGAIAVVGGPADRAFGQIIGESCSNAADLTGHLSLRESFAMVACADLVVCNSSVLMHAAAAFRKPTFVVLGEALESASHHQAQWGYQDTCICLGKEPGQRISIFKPVEVISMIHCHLAQPHAPLGAIARVCNEAQP